MGIGQAVEREADHTVNEDCLGFDVYVTASFMCLSLRNHEHIYKPSADTDGTCKIHTFRGRACTVIE